MGKYWKKFYECDCGAEALVMGDSYNDFNSGQCIDIAFFTNRITNILEFSERLRWCWNILKTGKPYTDMVILEKKVALKLARDIQNQFKRKEKNETT